MAKDQGCDGNFTPKSVNQIIECLLFEKKTKPIAKRFCKDLFLCKGNDETPPVCLFWLTA